MTHLTIDHSHIDRTDLELALANALLDPDGQIFPWRPMYPLAGQTVYAVCDGVGLLWIVVGKTPNGAVQLVAASNHDVQVTAPPDRVRPVTWSGLQEAVLTEMRRGIQEVTGG